MLPLQLERVYKKLTEIIPLLLKEKYLYEAGLLDKTPTLNKKLMKLFEPDNIKRLQFYNVLKNDRDKRILFELIDFYINSKLANQHTEFLKSLSRPIKLNGRQITFQKLQNLISNSLSYRERDYLFSLLINRIKEINPLLEDLFIAKWKILQEEFNFKNPLEFYRIKKNIDYATLSIIFTHLSKDLNFFYKKSISNWIINNLPRHKYRINEELHKNCHVVSLMNLDNLKVYYPYRKRISVFLRTLDNLDLLKSFNNSVRIDYQNRIKKTHRAACFGIRIPTEIYIVLTKRAGYGSYRELFHEGGHAVCLANILSQNPFYTKYWPQSGAIFEIPAFLFESLIRNPVWLRQELTIPEKNIKEIMYYTTLSDLYLLKRYIGKFLYECRLYGSDLEKLNLEAFKIIYSQILTEETMFFHEEEMYLYDLDPGIYSANYIRAWIGREQLINYLESLFGPEWFKNKAAGKFLKEVWKYGFREDMEEKFKNLGIGEKYDYENLVRKYKLFLR